MTRAFRVETFIAQAPGVVWDALTDWDRAHEWMEGVESLSAEGDTISGTRLTFRARGKDRPSEITACETGRRLVLRSIQGGVTADYAYEIEACEGGSRLSLTADCETRGLWTLLSPLLRLAMKMTDRKQVDALKAQLEQEASRTHPAS